eukprot:447827-Rhodomonas_salina.1
MRMVEMQSTALKVEQAALTGESASVNKNLDVRPRTTPHHAHTQTRPPARLASSAHARTQE